MGRLKLKDPAEKSGERLGPGAPRAAAPGEDKPSGAQEEGTFQTGPCSGTARPWGAGGTGGGLLTVLDGLSEEHQLHGHHRGGQIVLAKRRLHGRLQGRQVRQVLVHLGLPHEVPWARGAGLRPPGAGPAFLPGPLPHPRRPQRPLTEDGRALGGTQIVKREVKEGAELVADDAHEGLHVCRVHQPVREDSVGREGAEPQESRGQGPAAGAGCQAQEARDWRLSGASVRPRAGHRHLT